MSHSPLRGNLSSRLILFLLALGTILMGVLLALAGLRILSNAEPVFPDVVRTQVAGFAFSKPHRSPLRPATSH